MKAAAFALALPESVEEAVECLAGAGTGARLLAGGQSLMPLMAARAISPGVIVDLARVPGLDHITSIASDVVIGAMTRQRTVERSSVVAERVPLLALAVPNIAHVTVRNQGTVGGSVANADPTAEIPVVALAVDAVMVATGPRGTREIAARDFFAGWNRSCLTPGEVLTEIRFPASAPGAGAAFEEVSRRPGDVALASAAVMLRLDDSGRISHASIALGSVASTPVRAAAAETLLIGVMPGADVFAAAGEAAVADLDPATDLHATSAYRRHVAGVLVRRALTAALARMS